MKPKSKTPKTPEYLRPATRKWWASVVADYELEEHHIRLLTLACEAWDRTAEAREALSEAGMFTEDRFGQLRPHPAVGIERDSRLAFARLLRELALDVDESAESRPPRLIGRANLKAEGMICRE